MTPVKSTCLYEMLDSRKLSEHTRKLAGIISLVYTCGLLLVGGY